MRIVCGRFRACTPFEYSTITKRCTIHKTHYILYYNNRNVFVRDSSAAGDECASGTEMQIVAGVHYRCAFVPPAVSRIRGRGRAAPCARACAMRACVRVWSERPADGTPKRDGRLRGLSSPACDAFAK